MSSPLPVMIEILHQEVAQDIARVAPRARRVPIWRVRWVTEKEVRPTMPREVTSTMSTMSVPSMLIRKIASS